MLHVMQAIESGEPNQEEKRTKYMLCQSIPPENYNDAVDAFLEGGCSNAQGAEIIGALACPGVDAWLVVV